ncbi:MAG: hypothetical protein ABSD79_02570 [Dehalococcoidales bacterium]|jgi:predicted Zn finger-like uncharacterized protein
MFEDFEIEIHCPECDAELEVKLSQIAGEESVTCPCCKKSIGLKPDPKPGPEEVKKVDGSFESINQTIRKITGNP